MNKDTEFHSGFVAVLGRTSVGKSSLVNALVGKKVAIEARSTNTTRMKIKGILNTENAQVIFIDTPGFHKPRNNFSRSLNELAKSAIEDNPDVVMLVVDAKKGVGKGDKYIYDELKSCDIVVLNKIDLLKKDEILIQIDKTVSMLGNDFEIVPASAKTKENINELKQVIINLLPIGPRWFENDIVTDLDERIFFAEIIREQFLYYLKQELPHKLAVEITEFDWPYLSAEIIVQRPSQKMIVIGKNGSMLSQVRARLKKLYPDLKVSFHVKVDKNWERKATEYGYLK